MMHAKPPLNPNHKTQPEWLTALHSRTNHSQILPERIFSIDMSINWTLAAAMPQFTSVLVSFPWWIVRCALLISRYNLILSYLHAFQDKLEQFWMKVSSLLRQGFLEYDSWRQNSNTWVNLMSPEHQKVKTKTVGVG